MYANGTHSNAALIQKFNQLIIVEVKKLVSVNPLFMCGRAFYCLRQANYFDHFLLSHPPASAAFVDSITDIDAF